MAVVFKDLEAQVLALPEHERSVLMRRLLESLDTVFDDSPQAVAKAWDEEVARRVAEFEAGAGQDIPVEQVQAEVRALLDHGRT